MKTATHPDYYPNAKIICACGASYAVGSTIEEISVELCANCHPLYTGKQKILDTARRVELYETRKASKKEVPTGRKQKQLKRAAQKEKKAETKKDVA